ncbi:MAG: ATP-binding protein [Bacteroidales bacterium]|nr:ATP-binding protein [Bacteroidales bacterium]MBD5235419.1 ATP-binding protein [Barnesiella sp.]MBD5259039.1 ATP-binding protein [Barnesiella sp.]
MSTHIYKRKIYSKMLDWKQRSAGKTALLIEGARRIGKSTIAEEFAKNEYDDYLIIDFSNVGSEVIKLFDDISDLQYFFLSLQALTGKKLADGKSVIIFDEIQFCPKARQAIKHLVKDGRYDYIETGSLISIKRNINNILIPSEERRLSMYPLDFEEFLWAIDKESAFELIRYSFNKLKPLGDGVNREMMKLFRLYMIIGGMPQAISEYLDTSDFSAIDDVKRDILNLYIEDFRKIDDKGRAATIFRSIPAELSRNTMRYRVGGTIENARLSRLGEIFADINDSHTVNFAFHTSDPNVAFALHARYDFFKMFLADTGLFITLAFMDRDFTDNELYRKLLLDKLPTDLGYVYENVVAQLLQTAGHSLYYTTFKTGDEQNQRNYEIDFLISRKDKICPIEVKSSGYKSHKSLDEFQHKYSSRIAHRYLLYTKDIRKEEDIICLPVYMAGLL